MKEIKMNIRDHQCTVNSYGRITVSEPFFTATVLQLYVLWYVSKGNNFDLVAKLLNTTPKSISTVLTNMRRENRRTTTTRLVSHATQLGLLNLPAIEGIKVVKKSFSN